jgi:hypothetical protein
MESIVRYCLSPAVAPDPAMRDWTCGELTAEMDSHDTNVTLALFCGLPGEQLASLHEVEDRRLC